MQYKIIDLEQGSPEWLNFRKGKIGASMVASCVGIMCLKIKKGA